MTISTFSNFADSDLLNPANWDNGLPTSVIDALIDSAADYAGDFTCKSLAGSPGDGPYNMNGGSNNFLILYGNMDFGSGATQFFFPGVSPWVNLQFNATGSILGVLNGEIGTLRGRNAAVVTLGFNTTAHVTVDFTGTSQLNANSKNLTSSSHMTLASGGLTNSAGKTITCGGNFLTNGNLPGGIFAVTGTAIAAAGTTITNCNFTGTTLQATSSINGGGNTNVNFGSANPGAKTRGYAAMIP